MKENVSYARMALAIAVLIFALAVTSPSILASSCTSTGYYRDGINLTATMIVTTHAAISHTNIDATGCDIGVYFAPGSSGTVDHTTIHDARYFGILVRQGHVQVTHSKIHDIGNHPRDGTQHGVAVYYATTDAGSPASGPACVSGSTSGNVDHNSIYNYQKGGITVNCAGSKVHVYHNEVDGTGAPVNIAANGIQIGFGAFGRVDHNDVSGNKCISNPTCGPDLENDYQAAGILVYLAATGTEVDHNTLTNNDNGILVAGDGSTHNSWQIDHNQLTNNGHGAIVLSGATHNQIDHNDITGSSTLAPFSAGIDLLDNSNYNNVNHNEIHVPAPTIYDTSIGNVFSHNH